MKEAEEISASKKPDSGPASTRRDVFALRAAGDELNKIADGVLSGCNHLEGLVKTARESITGLTNALSGEARPSLTVLEGHIKRLTEAVAVPIPDFSQYIAPAARIVHQYKTTAPAELNREIGEYANQIKLPWRRLNENKLAVGALEVAPIFGKGVAVLRYAMCDVERVPLSAAMIVSRVVEIQSELLGSLDFRRLEQDFDLAAHLSAKVTGVSTSFPMRLETNALFEATRMICRERLAYGEKRIKKSPGVKRKTSKETGNAEALLPDYTRERFVYELASLIRHQAEMNKSRFRLEPAVHDVSRDNKNLFYFPSLPDAGWGEIHACRYIVVHSEDEATF